MKIFGCCDATTVAMDCGLFGDEDESDVATPHPKEADVFNGEHELALELPATSEANEPKVCCTNSGMSFEPAQPPAHPRAPRADLPATPQRLGKLLEQGKAMQQLFAIEALASAATAYGWQKAEPVVSQLLARVGLRLHEQEYAITAARCVSELAELPASTLSAAAAERVLLQPTLRVIDKTLSQEYLCCEWLHALLLLLPRLSRSTLEKTVLPYATHHGESINSTNSRLLCCTVLAAAARASGDAPFVARAILPKALSFCQDIELAVRCCMCRQLRTLAAVLGPELAGERLAAELIELQVRSYYAIYRLIHIYAPRFAIPAGAGAGGRKACGGAE